MRTVHKHGTASQFEWGLRPNEFVMINIISVKATGIRND